MNNVTSLATIIAAAAFIAAPAGAQSPLRSSDDAPVVRIALAGKSTVQINNEIKAAATTVCAGAASSECYDETVLEAKNQFFAIIRARMPVASSDRSAKL